MEVKATFVRVVEKDDSQKLWRLSRPLLRSISWQFEPESTYFVITSTATFKETGPETYIFAANEEGKIIDYAELNGSMRGCLDHEGAIRNAGWIITND